MKWNINDLSDHDTLELAIQAAVDFYVSRDRTDIDVESIVITFNNGKQVEVDSKIYGDVAECINEIINEINADAACEEQVRSVPYYQ